MKTPRRYAPMGGSLAPVRVAGFTWNGWQPSAVYAVAPEFGLSLEYLLGAVISGDFPVSLSHGI